MDSTACPPAPGTGFAAQLDHLRILCPVSAERIAAVSPPDSARRVPGRDGADTWTWSDSSNSTVWLGRTTMPAIRAAALVEAFQPGNGNVLLVGIGHGEEARLLLERLDCHQAVFVIEEDAAAAAMALSLHDLAPALVAGRLILLAGVDAWRQYEDFFSDHPGFVPPQRVLGWPWFDQQTATATSQRVSLANSISEGRREAAASPSQPSGTSAVRASGHEAAKTARIAILSNVPCPAIRRLAARLSGAATTLGYTSWRAVLDGPALVHPLAIDQRLRSEPHRWCILLDCVPASLAFRRPDAPLVILCSHFDDLSADWLGMVPGDAVLGVRTHAQKRGAEAAGIDPARVRVLPPAADGAVLPQPTHRDQIAVLADLPDPSPEAAGIHLASHCALWSAASRIIEARADEYHDGHAADVLAQAARSLKITLTSDEVRSALTDRIRRHLGPAIVHRAYCRALIAAGFDFEIWGEGAALDEELGRRCPTTGSTPGLLVCLDVSGRLAEPALDAALAGAALAFRRHPADESADGLGAVLNIHSHIHGFTSAQELLALARRHLESPGELRAVADEAARHIRRLHTWQVRLKCVLSA